ncbi:MAG: 50S ribosomal protein L17 [Coriobacteriia bacterium]|nr:50S ribosomal protein L17 [Coriobacteriia bacterium]
MRHYKRGRKLGTDASHTKAIKKNLVVALFTHDRIKTTLERAKEIRGDVDRVITWAKRGDVHSRRLAIAKLGDKDLVAEIFAKVEQGLFEGRNGGYTRIFKIGKRRGDDAIVVIMELVQEPVSPKRRDEDDSESTSTRRGLRGLGRRNRAAASDDVDVSDDEDIFDDEDFDEFEDDIDDEDVSDDESADEVDESDDSEAVADEEGEVAEDEADAVEDDAAEAAEDDAVDDDAAEAADDAVEDEAAEPAEADAAEGDEDAASDDVEQEDD